jgi:Zn-dependent protease
MNRSAIPLGRILGIPIGLDYSWFLIFALLTWTLAVGYFPSQFPNWPAAQYWMVGAMTALMMFASVLLHELGHSVVALHYKIPVRRITLFIFGGLAQIASEPPSPWSDFAVAIAGPIVSFALAALFLMLKPVAAASLPFFALVSYLAMINAVLAIFNLIPGFPLDGGRVLRSIVWGATKDMRRATFVAAQVGRFFSFLFILLGVWQMLGGNLFNGLWIAFIGWFLGNAALAQLQMQTTQSLLAGYRVSSAMSRDCHVVSPNTVLQQIVDDHILGAGQRCLLVGSNGNIVGLLTLHRLKETLRSEWPTTTAAQCMVPLEQLKWVAPDTELWQALEQMARDGVNQLPVMANGQLVGMVRREDVISMLRTLEDIKV